jgi:arylsulfatase A-like enzyme
MQRPNVLLIVMDTTRADHLSCYGHSRETTPNLDAFAAEGVRYTNPVAPAGWTLPSHVSLFTGLLPSEHGVLHGEYDVPEDVSLVAEQLSEAGYRTGGFSNNPWVSSGTDLDRGFDTFVEVFREHVHRYKSKVGRNLDRLKKLFFLKDTGAESTNEAVERWLDGLDDDEPFFGFINYMEPHQVYTPRRPFHRAYLDGGPIAPYREVFRNRERHRNRGRIFSGEDPLSEEEIAAREALYDGELAYLDRKIGELFDSLRERGLFDDTLVVVVGDHGEQLCDHSRDGGQLVDHHFSLHDPIVRVPFLVRHPELFGTDTVDTPVQLTDLVPTLASVVGDTVSIPEGTSSESLMDLPDERLALAEYLSPPPQLQSLKDHSDAFDVDRFDVDLRMVRSASWKYVYDQNHGEELLFDLSADPSEQDDLSSERDPPDRIPERMDEYCQITSDVTSSSGGAGEDDAVQEHLRDLGYR